MPPLSRHDMVEIDPQAWPAIVADAAVDMPGEIVRDWAEAKRPLVVRRPACDDRADAIPLGLPLPPSAGKRRLALRAPATAILARREPPLLRDCASVAPPSWFPAIGLILIATPNVRCYGSLAWEWLTGLPYVTESSDLDLLWPVADAAEADRVADAITTIEPTAPMRIDGELVTPSGQAVQWYEWQSRSDQILVKASARIALIPREQLFA